MINANGVELYVQVKESLGRGNPPETVAETFGLPLGLVTEIKEFMDNVKEVDKIMAEIKKAQI